MTDDESSAADDMTTEELLARADRGTPVEGARQKPPKSRKREDFAQRMHAVMGQTIAKSEAESLIVPIVSTPESRSRHITRRASQGART